MHSSSDEEDGHANGTKVVRSLFVRILKEHVVLLEKSKTPAMKKAKQAAWEDFASEYSAAVGTLVTVAQLVKALNNVKTTVKTKSDVKVTGNKPIKLKPWEKDFLELVEDSNPVFHKIPGNLSVGTSSGKSSLQLPNNGDDEPFVEDLVAKDVTGRQEIEVPRNENANLKNKIRKSSKFVANYETDATKDLSTPQLQRVVLLQQYKLNEMKMERKKMLLESLKKPTVEHSTQTDLYLDNVKTFLSL